MGEPHGKPSLLSKIYPGAQQLVLYMETILGPRAGHSSLSLVRDGDPQEYTDLLLQALVVPGVATTRPRIASLVQENSQEEVQPCSITGK